jgi:hypothetical protein
MTDDRVALADMPREDFFPEGLDEKSIEVVAEDKKTSALSKEATFDFIAPSPKKDVVADAAVAKSEDIVVLPDEVA